MDDPDLNADDLFLDAADMIVLGALSRIGSDSEARFRFFSKIGRASDRCGCVVAKGRSRSLTGSAYTSPTWNPAKQKAQLAGWAKCLF